MCHVHADLVCAASFKINTQFCMLRKPFFNTKVGDGRFSRAGGYRGFVHSHLYTNACMPAYRLVYSSTRDEFATNDRSIDATYGSRLELLN